MKQEKNNFKHSDYNHGLPISDKEHNELKKIGEADFMNKNLKQFLIRTGLNDEEKFNNFLKLYGLVFLFIFISSIMIGNFFEGIGLSILVGVFFYYDLLEYVNLQKKSVLKSNYVLNKSLISSIKSNL